MDLKVCRICGGVKDLKNIVDQDTEIMDKLLVCANISIYPGDLLPKLICQQCETNLNISYHLRKQSEATQKRLKLEIKREQNKIRGTHQSQHSKERFKIMSGDNSVLQINSCAQMEDIVRVPVNSSSEQVSEITNILYQKTESRCILEEGITEYVSCNKNCQLDSQILIEDKEKMDQVVIATEILVDNDDENINKSKDNSENNEATEIPLLTEYCSIDLLSSSSESTSDYGNDFEDDQVEDVNVLTCKTCQEVFTKKKDYSLHIKQHGDDRYQCIQCCKFFPTRFRLKRHEDTHIEIPNYKCSFCKRSYRVLYNLNRHIRSVHLLENNLECNICNVSFSRIDVLKRHLQLHSDEKNYRCSLCSQSFKTRDYLYAHNKKHHSENSVISKTYKRTKQKNVNKNQCGSCGKLFKSSFAYKNHLLIHTNEKPYECESCNKKFRTIAALTTHERIHEEYRPYQCDLCLKSFKQTAHLKEHKLLHLDNVPQHICSICHASFAKKGNLKAHMRTHTNEKLFKCADCPAEFSYLHLLQKHASKVHSRNIQKVYTLNDCDETIENDDGAKSNDAIESELYIDTVSDDDYDRNVVEIKDNNQEIYWSSPELEIINDVPPTEQHIFEVKNSALDGEPIADYIQIHSLDSIQSQLRESDLADDIDDNTNHISEKKVDIFVSEETKLTRSVYNINKLE